MLLDGGRDMYVACRNGVLDADFFQIFYSSKMCVWLIEASGTESKLY